jgi:hypothetical protein
MSETIQAVQRPKPSVGSGESLISELSVFTDSKHTISLDYNAPYKPQTPGIEDTMCKDDLRGQIVFPSCWDGKNVDSPDHKSHMAYPDGIDNGECPDSHPVRVPTIFYEVWNVVKPFNDLNDGGRFVLSTGDTTGFSMHADFLFGWDTDVFARSIEECDTADPSGVIQSCSTFQNLFNSDEEMNSCAAKNPLPQEEIGDGITTKWLPGCRKVTSGPAPTTAEDLDPDCVKAMGLGGDSVSTGSVPSSIPASASSGSANPVASSATTSALSALSKKAMGTGPVSPSPSAASRESLGPGPVSLSPSMASRKSLGPGPVSPVPAILTSASRPHGSTVPSSLSQTPLSAESALAKSFTPPVSSTGPASSPAPQSTPTCDCQCGSSVPSDTPVPTPWPTSDKMAKSNQHEYHHMSAYNGTGGESGSDDDGDCDDETVTPESTKSAEPTSTTDPTSHHRRLVKRRHGSPMF